MDEKELHLFLASLKKSPGKKGVFNPWYDLDRSNDESAEAPEIRRRQLVRYMEERRRSAKFVLVGEAAGYQGAKFSGIPMTSERILLGGKRQEGILPEHVFRGVEPRRTSRESLKPEGFSEPTATIVWHQLVRSGLSARQFVLWNAFPWHPYDPKAGLLSNRTPGADELEAGHEALTRILGILNRGGKVIALGEKAFEALGNLGVEARKVRHPAQGGARKFREEFMRTISRWIG
jgi:hypothetical protein